MLVNCNVCGKEFVAQNGNANKYCSHECYWNSKRTNEYILKDDYAIIALKSNKYGNNNVLIDLEDVEKCKQYCWSIGANGYVKATKYKNYTLHSLIVDRGNFQCIDHINLDKLDNRKCNLRPCNYKDNNLNTKARKHNMTGIKNITYKPNKQRYVFTFNRKSKHFKTLEEAIKYKEYIFKNVNNNFIPKDY